MTVRTVCGLATFRECSELLYSRRFSLMLKYALYEGYVRLAILYGGDVWCLKESEMKILAWTEIHGDSNIWSTAL